VIIYGSENRPHFAGPSYVRSGSESLEASREQFNELIAKRNSKVSRISEFKGEVVSVNNIHRRPNDIQESRWSGSVTVHYCDQFYVTLSAGPYAKDRLSFPLDDVEISFDDSNNRLLLKESLCPGTITC